MAAEIEQLFSRLKDAQTLEDMLRSLLPPMEQELLKYCAAVRMFDERLVDEIFRPELPTASKEELPFEKLIDHSFIERVAGVEGFYHLRENARNQYFDLWQKPEERISPQLRALSERLVRYYEALGAGWELDVLYHLIASDDRKAEELFNGLYDAADSRFDLGRCQDLLKILEARYTILSDRLLELFKEQQYYLKARGLWSREYYRTVYYYEIQELTDRFQQMLDDPSKWMLQLYARGGMGKTMFLRWLIARRCVPQPFKIPCAYIDFDFTNPVTATQNPWMLFLDIAQQLNEQIPGNLFSEQLGDLNEFKPLLSRSDSSQAYDSRLQVAQRREELKYIPERFVEALKVAQLKNKLVLIFDTLEEVILYQGTDMMAVLEEIEKLHGNYPNICLILSGRYDLAEKLYGFKEKYGPQTLALQLERFSDTDAKRYLAEKRGVTRLLDTVVKKAQGNPFQLSLYADILRSHQHLTRKQIEDFPSDLLYLIHRVLKRIPDRQVRWLLRYGVIPRKLRFSFVKEVMAPYLPKAMAGESGLDDPKKDLEPEYRSENAFDKVLASSKGEVDVERLWQVLTQYASSHSWVEQKDDTLSFHPDVLKPMRRLLRKQRIFRSLHRAAVNYYEKKAKAFPGSAGQSIQEAVYHKFQLEGRAAGAYWRAQLKNPLIAQRPEWMQELAREVVDLAAQAADDDQPTGETKDELIDKALLAEAYFEIARANIDMARANNVGPQDVLWQEASKDYAAFLELQKELKKELVPRARAAYVKAALLINDDELKKAHVVLANALKLRAKAEDKINLEMDYAVSLSRQGRQIEAGQHYRAALRLASRAKLKASQLIEISKRLANHYLSILDLKSAIHEYEGALKLAEKSRNGLVTLELSRHLAEVSFIAGQLSKADKYASATPRFELARLSRDELAKHPAQLELLHLLHLKTFIFLSLNDPFAAHGTSAEALSLIETLMSGASNLAELNYLNAYVREARGLISSELMATSIALDELEFARGLWKEAGDTTSANRCLLHMVNVQLRGAHNVKAARLLLDQVEHLGADALPEEAMQQEILRIAVLDQLNKPRAAKKQWQHLTAKAKKERWPAYSRAMIALTGLIHQAHAGAIVSLREAVATLKQVQPPSQRLTLLDDMRWSPTPKKVSAQLSTAFSKLLPSPQATTDEGALNALKMADALRVVRKKLSPKSLLLEAQKRFTTSNNHFALRKVYGAWDRLGWPGKKSPPDLSAQISEFISRYANYPVLCMVAQLEHVERLLKFKQLDRAEEMLTNVVNSLNEQLMGAYWTGYAYELRGRLLIERQWSKQKRRVKLDKAQQEAVKQGIMLLIQARNYYRSVEHQLAVKGLTRDINAENTRLSAARAGKGPPQSAARKKAGKPAPARRPGESARAAQEMYAARFANTQLRNKESVVELRSQGGAKGSLNVRTSSRSWKVKPLPDWMGDMLADSKSEIFYVRFPKLFSSGWQSVSRDMLSILEAIIENLPHRKGTSAVDLGLATVETVLAALPWELALLDSSNKGKADRSIRYLYRTFGEYQSLSWSIMFVQSALNKIYPGRLWIDGLYGLKTVDAVKSFQRRHRLPLTGIPDAATMQRLHAELHKRRKVRQDVLIVQPSSGRQLSAARGHGSGGVNLTSAYMQLGFKAEVLEYPTTSALAAALTRSSTQIIHLCPVMKRSPSVGIHLDFGIADYSGLKKPGSDIGFWSSPGSGSGEAGGRAGSFSLTGIGKLLEEFSYRNKLRPLLILDVPRPPVLGEAVTQMMLRNAFASQLLRLGNTSAVLATGLSSQTEQRGLTNMLLKTLAAGLPFGEIANVFRGVAQDYCKGNRLAGGALEQIIGAGSTALFTQDPAAWIQ